MNFPNPKYGNTVLDSCVLGTPGVEHDAATKILKLAGEGEVSIITTHGVIDEISHPSTPQHVRDIAASLIFTLKVDRNPDEQRRYEEIHAEMTGVGKPEKYAADADHLFEAGKYGNYFVTNDERILKKRETLRRLSGAFIVRPSEWLDIFKGNSKKKSGINGEWEKINFYSYLLLYAKYLVIFPILPIVLFLGMIFDEEFKEITTSPSLIVSYFLFSYLFFYWILLQGPANLPLSLKKWSWFPWAEEYIKYRKQIEVEKSNAFFDKKLVRYPLGIFYLFFCFYEIKVDKVNGIKFELAFISALIWSLWLLRGRLLTLAIPIAIAIFFLLLVNHGIFGYIFFL